MKAQNQKQIAIDVGISESFLSQIIKNIRRPSWRTAKLLAKSTGTDPVLWLDGTTEQIREALACQKESAA